MRWIRTLEVGRVYSVKLNGKMFQECKLQSMTATELIFSHLSFNGDKLTYIITTPEESQIFGRQNGDLILLNQKGEQS